MRILAKGAKYAKNDPIQGIFDSIDPPIKPLAAEKVGKVLKDPPESGGLLVACFQLK